MSFASEHIWIIGASSGIGEALARKLASEGATLYLSARRADELQALCSELGSQHIAYPLDVADNNALTSAAESIKKTAGKIDRVIFLAAIFRPNDVDKMDIDFAKKLIDVNVMGAIYTSYAALKIFEEQGAGQLSLCGSIAAYTGLPGGQPYCASKAAVLSLAESLAAETPEYVDIKLISPGFVRTRITDKNNFDMPCIIEPEQAANEIAKGLKKRAFEIHFPKRFTYSTKLLRVLPYPLALFITGRMRGKA